jgi:hypothetical protein
VNWRIASGVAHTATPERDTVGQRGEPAQNRKAHCDTVIHVSRPVVACDRCVRLPLGVTVFVVAPTAVPPFVSTKQQHSRHYAERKLSCDRNSDISCAAPCDSGGERSGVGR